MTIYLIRHAEEGETGGISRRGREQSEALGRWLKDKKIAALHSSDRPRAAETAAVVGSVLNLAPQTLPDFEETGELKLSESDKEAQSRAETGLRLAISQNPNQGVALVGHSKLIRQLLDKLGLRKYNEADADLPNTGIVVLDSKNGKLGLVRYGIYPADEL